jgi:hypothetical protein
MSQAKKPVPQDEDDGFEERRHFVRAMIMVKKTIG